MCKTIVIVDADETSEPPSTYLLAGCGGYQVHNFRSPDAFLTARLPERPDCLLLELRLPGIDGLELLRTLAKREDSPPVVITSDSSDVPLAVEAMKLGATDFLVKPFRPAALLQAIDEACVRREEWQRRTEQRRRAARRVSSLSPRLRQVLQGMAHGQANKVIAHELHLSIRTVEAYRSQLLAKLGARTTAAAIQIALVAGIDRSGDDRRRSEATH